MKPNSNLLYLAIIAGLVVLALGAWRPQTPVLAQAQTPTQAPAAGDCSSTRSVQVSGTAVVNVTPDRAMIQLGVESNGVSPDSVRDANMQKIQKVGVAMKDLGIDPKDIATDYYIVYPVYQDYNALAIQGYRVDNTVSITVRDVSKADDVIVAALKAGANEVQDVQFYTSELRKYRDQARDMAMKAAGEKAQALAGAANAKTGCVLSISENTWSSYSGSWRGGRTTALYTQNAVQNVAPQGGTTELGDGSPISLGQIAVQAQISATYSLKD
jgi:uncharacterized protein